MEEFRSKAISYIDEQALGNLFMIQIPNEALSDFVGQSPTNDHLGRKMDAIAWITQAMSLLSDQRIV